MRSVGQLDAVYVRGAQTGQARKQGVPESTISAIREKHSRGVPPDDAQIIDFTRALIKKHRADEAIVKALRQRFGDEQFIELTENPARGLNCWSSERHNCPLRK